MTAAAKFWLCMAVGFVCTVIMFGFPGLAGTIVFGLAAAVCFAAAGVFEKDMKGNR